MLYLIRQKMTPFGGAENYLARLSAALKRKNINHQIIYSSAPRWLPSWLKALWFNLEVCLKKRGFYFSLERISCPDIYRAGDGVHQVFLQTKGFSLNPLNPVYLFLEKKCFHRAKQIIANSAMVKTQIIQTYSIPADKISVIYNGITFKTTDFKQAQAKIRQEFQLIKNPKIILFVGSGFKRKGVKAFLEIVAKIQAKNCVAFIVGKDKNISYYKKLAEELAIKAFFPGERKDVDHFYAASDIFLFPTHYEPFSNVILEAASFKNVIFTTQQNGASEILPANFIMENPQDLSVVSKIEHFLKDESLLEQTKLANYNLAKQFTIERNVEETLAVIKRIDSCSLE